VTPTDQQRETEQARRDLEDIAALRASEPFNRYFLRCLRQKKDLAQTRALRTPGLTPAQREEERIKFLALEEIDGMMDLHAGPAQAMAQRSPISAPPMPR
jgi:hypothetical protein